jgi:hypothetical protein
MCQKKASEEVRENEWEALRKGMKSNEKTIRGEDTTSRTQ